MAAEFRPSTHPLVIHKLSYLRQPRSHVSSRDYSNLMRELGMLLAVEASADLPVERRSSNDTDVVQHIPPSFPKERHVLQQETRPVIISVVRSGLLMAEGVRDIIPTPYMGHIGIVVTPTQTAPFMVTLPESTSRRVCFVVDPFVVGGTTAKATLDILLNYGVDPANIRFLTLCMSRKGHHRLSRDIDLDGIRFHCGRIDGMGSWVPTEDWIDDFEDLNERLFRTVNRDEAELIQHAGDS